MTELKYKSSKIGITLLIGFSVLIVAIWITYHYLGDVFLNNKVWFYGVVFGAALLAILVVKALKKVVESEYIITLADNGMTIKHRNTEKRCSWNEVFCISFIMHGMEKVTIFNTKKNKIVLLNIPFSSSKKGFNNFNDLLVACQPYLNFIKTNEKIVTGTAPRQSAIYINEKYLNRIDEAKKVSNRPKRLGYIISLSLLAFAILFILFVIMKNDAKKYEIKNNIVYFDNQPIPNFKANEFRDLYYSGLAIDSSYVYQNGERTQLDRKTFKELGGGVYADKNGIYKQDISFWNDNTLKPLEGNYDKATFKQLESGILYKDKNHLYKLNYLAGADLQILDIEGMDLATIQSVGIYFLKDKNNVYNFSYQNSTIKLDKRFDAKTFVEINYYIVKDKNNVYYNSQNIRYKDQYATKEVTYKLLEEADAATFEMIDFTNFKDKNTTWTIGGEGEEVNFRK